MGKCDERCAYIYLFLINKREKKRNIVLAEQITHSITLPIPEIGVKNEKKLISFIRPSKIANTLAILLLLLQEELLFIHRTHS